ncbi:accessory Sec system translocase SecA2 [Fulvivirgaceae bacterium BMA10]|uniref:Protein translocase subunit SecA n=1 Tax=Splendidivirga corallicola TaxID=3051826 RepID=A0ABT8KMS0_9BACT|nr:accessory Sec system translocase SecA2 [Fulvivirgaceae bacterium BMA10]
MFKQLKKRFKFDYVERDLSEYHPALDQIRQQEKQFKNQPDKELRDQSIELIQKARNGASLKELLVKAYALVSEVTWRKLKMRPFDVQILAAIAMFHGNIAEMQTGEGKTLAATMPTYLHAISGEGVHIHTFNDYLAKRDANWMKPIYDFLGTSVGYIQEGTDSNERKDIYQKDIVYMTAKEGGFDYLRSFLVTDKEDIIQRKAQFAIIDEVDSILIDESRIPMVIAGEVPKHDAIDLYQIAKVIQELQYEKDFQTDEYGLNIFLTEQGIEKVEKVLNCQNLYAEKNEVLLTHVNLSLQAHGLLKRDIDYIVRDGKIELIDEFTGRIVDNRKWPHGLQAAIEAKENLFIEPEGKILGKTTLQHFINTYPKICGMTGTAQPAAEEFATVYGTSVTVIPTNAPIKRLDHPDLVFYNKQSKLKALVEKIKNIHETGRPILVGTASVEESEILSEKLKENGILCQTLNAKNDEEEAKIIAKAGTLGTVTISTNMAGRGTDIKLGGEEGEDRQRIINLGGLYVIGTNRFESSRIDNQLRGRSGRQGDPGESQFFVSLEDDLLQKHGIDELIPATFRNKHEVSTISSTIVNREVNRTQRIVEGKNFDIKRTLLKYASFIEMQKKIIDQKRNSLLDDTFKSVLVSHDEKYYQELIDKYGKSLVKKVEKQVTLAVLDKNWADYLEEVEHIRQGIHLFAMGGMNPLFEFQKKLDQVFSILIPKIEKEVIGKMKVVNITPRGIDLQQEGLLSPTSTWTYLINDNPFGDRLAMMLTGYGNIGFGAFAALLWPLLAIYYLVKNKLSGKK